MGSTVYIEIEQQTRPHRHAPRFSTISSTSPSITDSTGDFIHRQCTPPTLATCWEIFFALLASLITSAYTLHHEARGVSYPDAHSPSQEDQSQIRAFDPGHFSFILDPSPALMLFSCLILGCSISSFAYRRQDHDKLQTPIFVLAITTASTFGFGMGVNANLIMLGLIPWALCFAMIFSATVHWLARRCSRRTSFILCDIEEKQVLLHH
jgi:hypothetical protein